jgi:hypothetical protein
MHGDLSEQQKIGQKSSFFRQWKLTDHGKRANSLLRTWAGKWSLGNKDQKIGPSS